MLSNFTVYSQHTNNDVYPDDLIGDISSNDIEDDGASPLLHQLETDFLKAGSVVRSTPKHGHGSPFNSLDASQPSSLFGEVHLSEIKKLEEGIKLLENEKFQLSGKLSESQGLLEKSRGEVSSYQTRLSRLLEILTNEASRQSSSSVGKIHSHSDDTDDGEVVEDEIYPEINLLRKLLNKKFTSSPDGQLKENIKSLKQQIKLQEEKAAYLSNDLHILNTIAEEAQNSLFSLNEDLNIVSEDLATLYHHICHVNGETPSRVILDHASGIKQKDETSLPVSPSSPMHSRLDVLRQKLKDPTLLVNWKTISGSPSGPVFSTGSASLTSTASSSSSGVECQGVIDTIRDQVRHLKTAIQSTLDISKTPRMVISASTPSNLSTLVETSTGPSSPGRDSSEELLSQIVDLKALLSTKREQIATLRTVLKANKQTAEVALANLKSKYETEKAVVTETMAKLRNELKALKEDAATFASLRSMFAARCEEYVTQNDELQRQLQTSEDEKKTLNSLLRIAIQQKLSLTQKLEDLEVDRERNISLSSPRISGKEGRRHDPSSSTGRGSSSRASALRNFVPSSLRSAPLSSNNSNTTPQASPARSSGNTSQPSSSSANPPKK